MKIILVSHGSYSKGLLESAQMIAGQQEGFIAYGLYPEQSVATFKEILEKELKETPEGEEVVFLSDLFHGSPFNTVVSLMEHYDFYHITGVNLAMVIEAMMTKSGDTTAAELCEDIMEIAPDTIKDVRKLFEEDEEE